MFRKKITKKQASSTVYIIFFFIAFLAFTAFAVDGTITFTNRAKLQNITEATALAAASEFNYSSSATASDIATKVTTIANATFNILKQDRLNFATCNVSVNSNKVNITSEYISQPFFLSFLGVSGIKLEAKASAISEPLTVTANYPGINWLTSSAAYLSDILSKNLNLNDTAILTPIGNFPSASYNQSSELPDFSLIGGPSSTTDKSLSLGPGGFITIKLPAPMIDKPGYDLSIKEFGAVEGYMVFAGIDVDPANPYVNSGNTGSGINWINISCTGTSTDSALGGSANQTTSKTQLPTNNQDKFYGSGNFDIGKSCSGGYSGVSMVKYIRIIDDNQESAFMETNGIYYKTMIYGEASTATPGADIGPVTVLNHVRLLPSSS